MKFVAKNFDELTAGEVYEILKARAQIFMIEQDIRCLDMDGVDYQSRHFFLEENGKILAYLRAYYIDDDTVKIGRVLSIRHKKGLGSEVMNRALCDIKENMKCKKIHVDAQKQAAGFYEKFGFVKTSDEFLEEGIVHIAMQRQL
ncbi:MAG: GNAT family N-acetyltransferase [Ruminococcaceae bacterium]|nr:GNAT family N-acetyltransferase [Oscillospiraceae bacterium]